MKAYFVTGTDTGVGKTTLSVALLQAARARGLRTRAMKPAETGCTLEHGRLVPADATRLIANASLPASLEEACPYRFEPPLAPSVAAREAGKRVELATILAARDALCEPPPDLLLVEGAGGWLVPLNQHETFADLARALGYPVLVVAKNQLGVINHCLLTLEAIQRRELPVAGVILNALEPSEQSQNNAEEIRRMSGAPILGIFPPVPPNAGAQLGKLAEAHLELSAIL